MTTFIGRPVNRVDGRQKVTGGATYAAEFDVPRLAHGAIVLLTMAACATFGTPNSAA